MQITQAMKMVSAAKLKKAQSAIISMRPYSESLFSVITDILKTMPGFSSPLVGKKHHPKRLLISITSNRGLCGGFNSNIIKATKNYLYDNDDALYTRCSSYLNQPITPEQSLIQHIHMYDWSNQSINWESQFEPC